MTSERSGRGPDLLQPGADGHGATSRWEHGVTGGGLGGGLEAQPSRLSSLHVTPAVPGETALRQARAPRSLGPQTLLRSGCDLKELRRRGQATQLGVPVRCRVQGFGRVGRRCPLMETTGHADMATPPPTHEQQETAGPTPTGREKTPPHARSHSGNRRCEPQARDTPLLPDAAEKPRPSQVPSRVTRGIQRACGQVPATFPGPAICPSIPLPLAKYWRQTVIK